MTLALTAGELAQVRAGLAAPLPLPLLAALAEAFDESDLPWKVDLVHRHAVTDAFGAILDRSRRPLNPPASPAA